MVARISVDSNRTDKTIREEAAAPSHEKLWFPWRSPGPPFIILTAASIDFNASNGTSPLPGR